MKVKPKFDLLRNDVKRSSSATDGNSSYLSRLFEIFYLTCSHLTGLTYAKSAPEFAEEIIGAQLEEDGGLLGVSRPLIFLWEILYSMCPFSDSFLPQFFQSHLDLFHSK